MRKIHGRGRGRTVHQLPTARYNFATTLDALSNSKADSCHPGTSIMNRRLPEVPPANYWT
jgi:hypothetical protein